MRLRHLILSIISPEQGGFVLGMEIAKGAIVVHEVLHCTSTHKILALIIKLDMMKAYGKVNWDFLMDIFYKLGFDRKLGRWIYACISGAIFLVLINGSTSGLFSSSQGIRQGDPLSPLLFIILPKTLSKSTKREHSDGIWKGIHIPHTSIDVTHSLFTYDIVLFGLATIPKAKTIKKVLETYMFASNQ